MALLFHELAIQMRRYYLHYWGLGRGKMKAVKIILALVGVVVLFFGLVFLVGGRPLPGGVMIGLGVFLVVYGVKNPRTRDVVIKRELELSGDVKLEGMKCTQCGGTLSSENLSFKAGTIFVTCPFCHSEYQIEEAPKW